MGQKHTICLSMQINFEYPETEIDYKKAMRRAIRLAMNPNLKDSKDGTKVVGVLLTDPECPSLRLRTFGEL